MRNIAILIAYYWLRNADSAWMKHIFFLEFQSDDWTLDSIFSLNDDFLRDLNELDAGALAPISSQAYDSMSPLSIGTESEIDQDIIRGNGMANNLTEGPILSPPQNYISSSSSDSGLSSDNIDL